MTEQLPDLDRHAMVAADLAFIGHPEEGPVSTMKRTERAIRIYLWALNRDQWSADDVYRLVSDVCLLAFEGGVVIAGVP